MQSRVDRRTFLAGMASLSRPAAPAAGAPESAPLYLETRNGWYTQGGKVIRGYARSSPMWAGYRGRPVGW